MRTTVVVALCAAMAYSPTVAQSSQVAPGLLAGKATDEARKPYVDYAVQLRDAATGQAVGTRTLDDQGAFAFTGLAQGRPYLLELFDTRERRVICTEGPFVLTADRPGRADVNINCGKGPAALWLLLAGAASAVAIATRSASR